LTEGISEQVQRSDRRQPRACLEDCFRALDAKGIVSMLSRQYRIALTCILLSSVLYVRFCNKTSSPSDEDNGDVNVPQPHYLVDKLGREIYQVVNGPKYKFYIYMTGRKLPDERSTIAFISTVCNVLYGICVWFGFMFLDRTYMLLGTLLTLYVGPAIILVFLGFVGGALAAFAVYPIVSVLVMWILFFLSSQIAQTLGKYLGCDSDDDGEIDYLDLLHWAASKRLGKLLGIPAVYKFLNKLQTDPFVEMHKRLDRILEMQERITHNKDKEI
jgi:hypothetical protein